MTSPQIALLAIGIGALLGAAVVLLVLWAYRARAHVQEEASRAIPDGAADVLAAMDDAACVVDGSGLVLAASKAAARFGVTGGGMLKHPELRRLVREVRAGGASHTESLRIGTGAQLDPRLVSARASALGAQLTLLIIRDVTEQ